MAMQSVWKQRFSEALRNVNANKGTKGLLSAFQNEEERQSSLEELRVRLQQLRQGSLKWKARTQWRYLVSMSFIVIVIGVQNGRAQETEWHDTTPPRLSLADGSVSFWRPGAQDWTRARVNTPLTAGDELYTSEYANCEVQIGPHAFVRTGEGASLRINDVEPNYLQLGASSGNLSMDIRELPPGQSMEVDTPNAVLTIDRPGYYRINVEHDAASFFA
jgi:hypothetical protein